ncbi:helix-turn-helix domain-containing protein [Streptomyces sp. NPDC058947]|uniref:helix-turn-helix domain-containing protein n=1 Tax=Streptomyces sp. NPDC058947 TaxID=3346675 RepID=UPI00367A0E0C
MWRNRTSRPPGSLTPTTSPCGRCTACARAWGFTGPSHFTRRFRAAYGVTPRRLRAAPPGPAE